MDNVERILIKYHRDRGDSKVRLRSTVTTPTGVVYLMRFYNSYGSCYSSIDRIDENGVVIELERCHQLDERAMLRPYETRRESNEADR